jgi:hypothetical protein
MYVINPKNSYTKMMTYSFADYIRLTAITYQSFGLDKNKAPAFADALFLVFTGRNDTPVTFYFASFLT